MKRTLPAVAEALNDEDLALRGWAQRFLCDFGAALDPTFSIPLRGLYDEHPSLRAAAVRLLAKLPSQQALPLLESKLRDQDCSVRLEAAKVLSQHNPDHAGIVPAFVEHLLQGESIGPTDFSCLDRIMEKAAPMLQQALRSGDAKTRVAIICSLGWSKTQAAFSTVVEMLDDPAPEVRAQAASSLWHFVDTQDILPHLLKGSRDTDQQVRHQARWALRMSGLAKKALPDLIGVLGSDGPDAREFAAWGLSELGGEAEAAVPALERNLDHDSAAVRLSAAVALAHIRPDNARLPSILWEGLSHPSWEIRDKSFQGLKNLGSGVRTILPQLIDGLEDPSKRSTSAALLSQVGLGASKAMNRLLSLLKLPIPGDRELKHYVPIALASIGPRAVGPLLGLLEHRDLFVRTRAIRTLGLMRAKGESTVPRLIEKLQAGDTAEQIVAADALGEIGPAARSAIPVLRLKLKDPDLAIRQAAMEALGKMQGAASAAVPALGALLYEPTLSMHMKWAVIRALAGIGTPGVPVLVAALRNKARLEVEVRSFAATMLAGFGRADPAVISALAESLRDADPGVRDSAARAIGKIGPAAQTATSQLVELLNGECDIVRETAGHALSAIAAAEPRPESAPTAAC